MSAVSICIRHGALLILPWTIIEGFSDGCSLLDIYEGVKSMKFFGENWASLETYLSEKSKLSWSKVWRIGMYKIYKSFTFQDKKKPSTFNIFTRHKVFTLKWKFHFYAWFQILYWLFYQVFNIIKPMLYLKQEIFGEFIFNVL